MADDVRTSTGELYPLIEPFNRGNLDVGDGHTLYWEECGNPDGPAVVFLHGGPGAGCAPSHRRLFDPGHWRIVLLINAVVGYPNQRRGLKPTPPSTSSPIWKPSAAT